MAENMPQNPTDALEWIEIRAERWVQHADAIGLGEAFAQDVLLLAEQARARRLAADEAAARAKSATQFWRLGIGDAKKRARAAIATIKAHAAATGDPEVYALAGLSKRAGPGEAPPPKMPRNLKFTVRPRGDVELSWKGGGGGGPQGTYYVVQRSLGLPWNWSVLGTTTSKRFVDGGLPIGAHDTYYAVIARHGKHEVWGNPLLVRLGTRPAGGEAAPRERAA